MALSMLDAYACYLIQIRYDGFVGLGGVWHWNYDSDLTSLSLSRFLLSVLRIDHWELICNAVLMP